MKYEVSKGYWYFKPVDDVNISTLAALNFDPWGKRKPVRFQIEVEDDSVQPNERQFLTLDFIIGNQSKLIQAIFDYYIKVILPVFASATDVDESEIASAPADLSRVIGIQYIEIPSFAEEDGCLYFVLGFTFKHDIEHGLSILFKNDRVIDFAGKGERDYDAVAIFNTGIFNRDGSPIKISVYGLQGETIFTGRYLFDEVITHSLKRGAYRTFYTCNDSERCRNFHIPEDLEQFTLRQLLTY